jgi:cobyrinic acid a,c-diamide synthase
MNSYSSIKVANSGWVSPNEAIDSASKNYDFLLIEGAMGPFTGFLNKNAPHPASTAEIAAIFGVPTIIVVACDKAGIEGAVVTGLNYVNLMKTLGINIAGIVLNKVNTSYLTPEIMQTIISAFDNLGVQLIGILPRIHLEGRGAIPEIEIRYEDFGAKAVETVETFLDLNSLTSLAKSPMSSSVDYRAFQEKFELLIGKGCIFDLTKGESE